MTPFGRKVGTICDERRLSQQRLARMAKVGGSQISSWKSGRRGPPPAEIVAGLAEALGLSEGDRAELALAASLSRRTFQIPVGAVAEAYEFAAELEARLGRLDSSQIRALRAVLSLEVAHERQAGVRSAETEGAM